MPPSWSPRQPVDPDRIDHTARFRDIRGHSYRRDLKQRHLVPKLRSLDREDKIGGVVVDIGAGTDGAGWARRSLQDGFGVATVQDHRSPLQKCGPNPGR